MANSICMHPECSDECKMISNIHGEDHNYCSRHISEALEAIKTGTCLCGKKVETHLDIHHPNDLEDTVRCSESCKTNVLVLALFALLATIVGLSIHFDIYLYL